MAFDATEYDHHDLQIAYKIFDQLLGDLEEARLDTMRKNDELTANEAFALATEIKVYANIKELAREELGLRELDIANDEVE